MEKMVMVSVLCLGFMLAACSEKSAEQADNNAKMPEVGTSIATLAPEKTASESGDSNDEVLNLEWEDLVPAGFEPETIMAKYAEQIDQISEGTPEDDALMEKILAEFNAAPSNAELSGKRVRIPGFISLLDEENGMVGEFLLVPYFGACIHAPPPPVNQTLLVKPDKGKSLGMEAIYQPVWVTGEMKVERLQTALAEAGYVIEHASLEVYEEEDEVPADPAAPAGE